MSEKSETLGEKPVESRKLRISTGTGSKLHQNNSNTPKQTAPKPTVNVYISDSSLMERNTNRKKGFGKDLLKTADTSSTNTEASEVHSASQIIQQLKCKILELEKSNTILQLKNLDLKKSLKTSQKFKRKC